MKSLTVRQRIVASFALILSVIVCMTVLFYVSAMQSQGRADEAVNKDLAGVLAATKIRQHITDHLNTTQQLLIELESAHKAKLVIPPAALSSLSAKETEMAQAYADYVDTLAHDEDRSLYRAYGEAVALYLQSHKDMLGMLNQGRLDEARKFSNDVVYAQWINARTVVNKQIDLNQALVRQALDEWKTTANTNQLASFAALIVATLFALACGIGLSRAIMRPIEAVVSAMAVLGRGNLTQRLDMQRSDEFAAIEHGFNDMLAALRALVAQAQNAAVQLTTSITEVAASSRQQQATVTESAATTREIGVTSREISATSRDLVRTMSEVSGSAESTAALADSGQMGVLRMGRVMEQLTGAADLVKEKLSLLNDRASGINKVVTTIVKVADQTNLLSLNAAIEAEKAGEYGRGFAVVASEVRRLADQTAVATYDIEQMVREIQSAVSAGVMGMDKFSDEVRRGNAEMGQVGEQLSQIIQQVQALAPRVQFVNESMQVQATGAQQIDQALSQLSDANNQTAESLRQASLALDDVSNVASGLRAGVSRFQV